MYPNAPRGLIEWLSLHSRKESIHQHSVGINADWWNDKSDSLPGLPLSFSLVGRKPQLARGEIFELAKPIRNQNNRYAALRLLWHTLAWGTGPSQRGNKKRITAVMANLETNKQLLAEAAVISRQDPIAAFKLFRPGRVNQISNLGPNFFTKYLYFAGAGKASHPCTIVDARVRATLYKASDSKDKGFAPLSQYMTNHYQQALDCIISWTQEATSTIGRPVAIDEVERWAFGR